MRYRFVLLFLYSTSFLLAQDSSVLKVHFLYGSKPHKKYKASEKKQFGGILGGHVGIELADNEILSFMPKGKFHVFRKKKNRHSTFALDSEEEFYTILGGDFDSLKKMVLYIPISHQQKVLFDSISTAYLSQTPYDYAFFGMRCGAATYEILAQLAILKPFGIRRTFWTIFYPRKLRKRLLKKANNQGWRIEREKGTSRRKWEKD